MLNSNEFDKANVLHLDVLGGNEEAVKLILKSLSKKNAKSLIN